MTPIQRRSIALALRLLGLKATRRNMRTPVCLLVRRMRR